MRSEILPCVGRPWIVLFIAVLAVVHLGIAQVGAISHRQDETRPTDPPPEKPQDAPPEEDDLFADDDELFADDEDLFGDDEEEAVEPVDEAIPVSVDQEAVDQAHEQVFLAERFPPARACGTCHPKQYREWSVSQHAYAQMSPIFNAMQGTVTKLTNGTNGDFCIRCHTPVGMILDEPVFMSNIDRHPTAREGVTCIVCHRVNKAYGKVSGRLFVEPGGLTDAVYGPTGGDELQRVLESPDEYRVQPDPDKPGRKIHATAEAFLQLTTPAFCGTCHDVTLVNGFRLEEAFSSFKTSPAAKRGESCQDCHMGIEPGVAAGYETGPAAIVGGIPTMDRKVTNHYFAGPDFPIIHPGLFPHNILAILEESEKDDPSAEGLATIRDWLLFDHEAGWGTDEFEDNVADDYEFPDRWTSVDDRYDARVLLEENFELLRWADEQRLQVLRNGYKLGDIVTERADKKGIRFKVPVRNGTDGHDVPTGFDAERLVFLEVTVTDRYGDVVMKSGDLDPNGDVRDLHSRYVHNGDLPLDKQLFSLQSRFVTRNIRGGEREQVLPVNVSIDPLPFIRPETRSTIIYGRPLGARKHRRTLPPQGERWAKYRIDRDELTGKGPYKANVKLMSSMIPVNLLSEIQIVGFDYDMTPRELADGLRAGMLVVWEKDRVFDMDLPD